MQSLQEKLKNFTPVKKTKITNERQLIIKEFVDRLNMERGKNFKPLSPGFVGMKMASMTTSQLKTFLGECKYANHFSKYWWYKLNPKNYK